MAVGMADESSTRRLPPQKTPASSSAAVNSAAVNSATVKRAAEAESKETPKPYVRSRAATPPAPAAPMTGAVKSAKIEASKADQPKAEAPSAVASKAGAKAPPAKNYYDQLFGEDAAEVTPVSGEKSEEPAGGDPFAGETYDPADKSSDVIPADYQAEAKKVTVQQVSHPASPAPRSAKTLPASAAPSGTTPASAAPARAARELPANKLAPASKAALPRIAESSKVTQVSAETPSHSASATETPKVTLKWVARGELSVGQETICQLVVKNEGEGTARDVRIDAHFPRDVRLLKADPAPAEARDHLAWDLPTLAAGEEKTISITMMPSARGDIATSATVRFSGAAVAKLHVEEPKLAISIKGSPIAMVGESTSQVVTVSNPGTGVARDIVIRATIPAGLEYGKGKQVTLPIGSLSAGESREVKLAMTAVGNGEQVVLVEASAAGNISQSSKSVIQITAPKLDVAISGPGLRYLNRAAKYQVTVSNKCPAATNNVQMSHVVPQGFEFVKADGGGTYDDSTRTVNWFIGHLEAGRSVTASVELMASALGTHQHKVKVSGDSGVTAESKTETKVDGASALVMEVSDLDDPVEVNTQTAYEIRVKNDGSKAATNLAITCELPPGTELINADGPTRHSIVKGKIVFASVADLPPQKSITFRVMLKGKAPGQHRFRAQLTSTSSPEPVVVEELTRFYAD